MSGEGILPYMACTGMCRWKGDGFWPLCPKHGIACPKQGNTIEGVVLNRVLF